MSTAVQTVLSIKELLEIILQPLNYNQLFVLRRVNKTFESAIRNSFPLQQAMHLAYPPSSPEPLDPRNLFPMFALDHCDPRLKLKPFQYIGIASILDKAFDPDPDHLITEPVTLQFELDLKQPFHKSAFQKGGRLGLLTKFGKLSPREFGSWAKMSIAKEAQDFDIKIYVDQRGKRGVCFYYCEHLEVRNGERATLGGLFEFLEVVKARTQWEHLRREKELGKRGWWGPGMRGFGEAMAMERFYSRA